MSKRLGWFMFYGVSVFGALTLGFALLPAGTALPARLDTVWEWLAGMPEGVKLVGLGVYLSFCCTLLPLPTSGVIAALAAPQAWVGTSALVVVSSFAAVGALGSTVANVNDYHFFEWLFEQDRVGKVRDTKFHQAASRWFERTPFFLLFLFNLLPLPVDIVRLLAVSSRYDIHRFAVANFLGRFLRYGILAFITYTFALGLIAPLALLGVSVTLALGRWVVKRLSTGVGARYPVADEL